MQKRRGTQRFSEENGNKEITNVNQKMRMTEY